MCPVCLANAASAASAAMIAGVTASTGGAAALALKVFGIQSKTRLKENDHDKESSGKSPGSFAS
jgi:hypothetical protein